MKLNMTPGEFQQTPGKARPLGQWIRREEERYVAIDNLDGNVWVEDFKSRAGAVKWLEAVE